MPEIPNCVIDKTITLRILTLGDAGSWKWSAFMVHYSATIFIIGNNFLSVELIVSAQSIFPPHPLLFHFIFEGSTPLVSRGVLYRSFVPCITGGLCPLLSSPCGTSSFMYWPHVLATCSRPLSAISWPHMDPCRTDAQMDTVGIRSLPGRHSSLPVWSGPPRRMAPHHTVTSGGFQIHPLALEWFKC